MPKLISRIGCAFLLGGVALGLCSCGTGSVAVVNGQKISAKEFYTFAGRGSNGANALVAVILERMVTQAAQKAGVTVNDKEINDWIQDAKDTLKDTPGAPTLEEYLKDQFLTWEEFRWQTRLNLILEKLCSKDVQVTDEKVKSYFDQNHEKLYDKPDRVGLHVMVLTSEKEALSARKQLLDGTSFEKLAQEMSLQFRENGGAVPMVGKGSGTVPDSVFDAAWKMNAGEITSPIKDKDKYFLARLDAKYPGEKADYEKNKDKVRRDYLRANGTPPQIYMMNLSHDAKVQILWPQFSPLEKQFAPPSSATPPASAAPPAAPAQPSAQGQGTKPESKAAGTTPPSKGKTPPTPK